MVRSTLISSYFSESFQKLSYQPNEDALTGSLYSSGLTSGHHYTNSDQPYTYSTWENQFAHEVRDVGSWVTKGLFGFGTHLSLGLVNSIATKPAINFLTTKIPTIIALAAGGLPLLLLSGFIGATAMSAYNVLAQTGMARLQGITSNQEHPYPSFICQFEDNFLPTFSSILTSSALTALGIGALDLVISIASQSAFAAYLDDKSNMSFGEKCLMNSCESLTAMVAGGMTTRGLNFIGQNFRGALQSIEKPKIRLATDGVSQDLSDHLPEEKISPIMTGRRRPIELKKEDNLSLMASSSRVPRGTFRELPSNFSKKDPNPLSLTPRQQKQLRQVNRRINENLSLSEDPQINQITDLRLLQAKIEGLLSKPHQEETLKTFQTDIQVLRENPVMTTPEYTLAFRRVMATVEVLYTNSESPNNLRDYIKGVYPGVEGDIAKIYSGHPLISFDRQHIPPNDSIYLPANRSQSSQSLKLYNEVKRNLPRSVPWDATREDLLRTQPDSELTDRLWLSHAHDQFDGLPGVDLKIVDVQDIPFKDSLLLDRALHRLGKRNIIGSPARSVILITGPQWVMVGGTPTRPNFIELLSNWTTIHQRDLHHVAELRWKIKDGNHQLAHFTPSLMEALLHETNGPSSIRNFSMAGRVSLDSSVKLRGEGLSQIGWSSGPIYYEGSKVTVTPWLYEEHDLVHLSTIAGLPLEFRAAAKKIYQTLKNEMEPSPFRSHLMVTIADFNFNNGLGAPRNPYDFILRGSNYHSIGFYQEPSLKKYQRNLVPELISLNQYERILRRLASKDRKLREHFHKFAEDALRTKMRVGGLYERTQDYESSTEA